MKNKQMKCPGGNCPLKSGCMNYEPDLKKLVRGVYMPYPPYKIYGDKLSCEHYSSKSIFQQLKNIVNATKQRRKRKV